MSTKTEVAVGRQGWSITVSSGPHATDGMAQALTDSFKAMSSRRSMTGMGRKDQ